MFHVIDELPAAKKSRWGKWSLCEGGGILHHDDIPEYEISLDEITDSAECLDWIMQVSGKSWFSSADIADFLEAIRETVDPQRNLCCWGISSQRASKSIQVTA